MGGRGASIGKSKSTAKQTPTYRNLNREEATKAMLNIKKGQVVEFEGNTYFEYRKKDANFYHLQGLDYTGKREQGNNILIPRKDIENRGKVKDWNITDVITKQEIKLRYKTLL